MDARCAKCNGEIKPGEMCRDCRALRLRTLLPWVGCLAPVFFFLAAVVVPNYQRAAYRGEYSSCEANVKNIATALEMYYTDSKGHYPRNFDQLTPNYLRVVPTCPAVGTDTYSKTYVVAANPPAYTFCCAGPNHTRILNDSSDFPQYNSTQGFVSGH